MRLPAKKNMMPTKRKKLRARPEDFLKTVSVLFDTLPGFDPDAAEELCSFMAAHGWDVSKISVEDLCSPDSSTFTLGGILMIPDAAALPLETAPKLREYCEGGGKLLLLGGPLFHDGITRRNGRWTGDPEQADSRNDLRMEGVYPSCKIFLARDKSKFDRWLRPEKPVTVVAPCPRSSGAGFSGDRENRFLPLERVSGERSSAAFIMLNATRYRGMDNSGLLPGSVCGEVFGSVAAGIGIQDQRLLEIPGADRLLLEIMNRLSCGIFLFEGGCGKFVFRKGETLTFGARILNGTQLFRRVSVRFIIRSASGTEIKKELPAHAMEQNMTDVRFSWTPPRFEAYRVTVELPEQGDRIEHELLPITNESEDRDDFVRVKGRRFVLHGETWDPVPANYWPLYFPTLEQNVYFRGWLDRSTYDPEAVEADLKDMAARGINLLLTRMEVNLPERIMPQLQHFLLLCSRYGMKLILAASNWTNPLFYDPVKFEQLVRPWGLEKNTTLLGYDIGWEFGHRPLNPLYRHFWDREWKAWIEDQYGSFANAAADWGVPAECDDLKNPVDPLDRCLPGPDAARETAENPEPGRIRAAACRRFMDDMLAPVFFRVTGDIRKTDPRHLISFRQGRLVPYGVTPSAAIYKYLDFLLPEGYHIEKESGGREILGFEELLMNFLSGGKPSLWVEFGKSLCGNAFMGPARWDIENCRPYPEDEQYANDYMDFICDALVNAHVTAFAPWMWPGGRRMNERSDYGLVGPDGLLRENGRIFFRHAARMPDPLPEGGRTHVFSADPDAHAGGNHHMIFHEGREAFAKYGDTLLIRTAVTGLDSSEVPALAVGNVPWNGHNPHKYLNAFFTRVRIDGTEYVSGDTVTAARGAKIGFEIGVGNLHEVKWLRGDIGLRLSDGTQIPLEADVPGYGDTVFRFSLPVVGSEMRLRMSSASGVFFGRTFSIRFRNDDGGGENASFSARPQTTFQH